MMGDGERAIVPLSEDEWTVDRILGQTLKIKHCMTQVMKADEHYGVIPGTGGKPSLLKPGAEKLCLMFRLSPSYETELAVEEPAFILFRIKCTLTHFPTGRIVASGLGSCSSREEKYGWRKAARKCPRCAKETIFRSNGARGSEGWYCWRKKDGCGATFPAGDASIESQESGKKPVENVWDQHNTILKMACKRALVAAVLNGTAASDFFTQDLEDLVEKTTEAAPPAAPAPNMPAPRAGGPGNWPKPEYIPPVIRDAQENDDLYRATVGAVGLAPSQLERDLQKAIDANTIEVLDPESGEVTKQPKATPSQLRKIRSMLGTLGIEDPAFHAGLRKYYRVSSTTVLTRAQAADTIERLTKTQNTARNAGIPIPPEPEQEELSLGNSE